MTALEQVGLPYEDVAINLAKGEQTKPQFRAVSPRGKVPALQVDDDLLTENLAIILWLESTHPDAGLLPKTDNAWDRAKQLADLIWISATWHPYVRANMMPVRWTTGDPAPVRERGKELIKPCLDQLEARLDQSPWWFGSEWSIADVYFYWCYTTAEQGEFSLAAYPNINRHRVAVEAIPAFKRAVAREQAAAQKMA